MQPGRKALLPTVGSQGNKGTATGGMPGRRRPNTPTINSPASQLQQPGLALAARPTAILKHERDKGVGTTTMHPRDRLARRPVSIKLGLLTLSSRETRDCGTPPDRGVLPHRGEGRINHQVVALTIKVQRHKIPRSCVIQRAHPAELDLDAVTREACLLDDGSKLQN